MNDVMMNESKVFDACALIEEIAKLADAEAIRSKAQAAANLLNQVLEEGRLLRFEKVTVGENIKKIRKQKGLTQKRLGELCGINEVQIRRYEIGKANPKIETVDKIASALGVKLVL